MASQDFLLRAKRPASLVAFNGALPGNFKLIVRVDGKWVERSGVNLDPIASLELVPGDPPTLSSDIHYNLRVTDAWSGWDNLDKSKLRTWFKNNATEHLDAAAEHPRSGRTMRWFRWSNATEWLDITIDEPVLRRRVWL